MRIHGEKRSTKLQLHPGTCSSTHMNPVFRMHCANSVKLHKDWNPVGWEGQASHELGTRLVPNGR